MTLFDKVINLTLADEAGNSFSIGTPPSGRKPTIRLSGSFVSQTLLQQIEIRLTNLATDKPLNTYKKARVVAGYGTQQGAQSPGLQQAFEGEIWNSYQELPGPDGVTVLQMMLGDVKAWTGGAVVEGGFSAGTPLRTVFSSLCNELNMTLLYSMEDVNLPIALDYTGAAKDVLDKIKDVFYSRNQGISNGIEVQPFGNTLIVRRFGRSSGRVYLLDFISHARHSAAGFDIVAPWVPPLAPGDELQIDPKFFRQDVGAALAGAATSGRFQVYLINFEFCTTDDTNQMEVMTVGAGGAG